MRRSALAVVCTTGLLFGFAQLESPWHLLGFVCLVPFLWALEQAASARRALLLGALQAVGFCAAALAWFPQAVHRYTGTPAWAVMAGLLVLAPLLQPQFPAWALARWALKKRGAPAWMVAVGAALAAVGVEGVVPRLFDTTLGYALYPAQSLRQAADLAGVRGLTLLLLLANEAAWALWRDRSQPKRAALRACALALPVLLALSYGAWRSSSLSEAMSSQPLKVGVVQSNLTRYGELAQKLGTYDAARTILDAHYALSRELLRSAKPELLVWPETAYPTTFGAPKSDAGAELDDELRRFAQSAGVPLLFGTYASDGAHEYNAAVLLSAAAQTYRKVKPFPLTEYVPPLLDGPRVRALFPWLGTWSPGPGARVFTLARAGRAPLKLMPLICYDITEPALVAEAARQGADAIVSMANDGWFAGTAGARQHLVVAAFRSIETRLPQVRATTSGISADIDVLGRITHRTDEDRAEVLAADLHTVPHAPTLAVDFGGWFSPLALVLALAFQAAVFGRRGAAAPPGRT